MRTVRRILFRIILGLLFYILFVQPIVWKYTLKTFKPSYSRIERIVDVKGLVLHREEIITAPVSGIFLRLRKDFDRVGKGEELAIIFPTMEDYNSYVAEIERVQKYYEDIINSCKREIVLKRQEIEKTYKELSKEIGIVNSLVLNKQDIGDRIKRLNDLNSHINSLHSEVDQLDAKVKLLGEEREKKMKDIKERAISLNSVVLSSQAGLVVFSIDSKEGLRNSIIEGKIKSFGKEFDYISDRPKVISDGKMIKKGEIIGKIIDNLEQFALLYIKSDGGTDPPHDSIDIHIKDRRVRLEPLSWVKDGLNEIWLCKIKDRTYIDSSYFSAEVKIGDIEGITVPRSLVKEEDGKSYVFILKKDSVEKRSVNILGGNKEMVVLGNIEEGEILIGG